MIEGLEQGELARVDRGLRFAGTGEKALEFAVQTSPGHATGGMVSLAAGRDLAKKLLARWAAQTEPLYVRLRELVATSEGYSTLRGLLEDVAEYETGTETVRDLETVLTARSALRLTFGEITESVLDEVAKDLEEIEDAQYYVQGKFPSARDWTILSDRMTTLEQARSSKKDEEERWTGPKTGRPVPRFSILKVSHTVEIIED